MHEFMYRDFKQLIVMRILLEAEVATSSNAVFLNNQDSEGHGAIVFNFSNGLRGEKEPLLLQRGTQYSC
ncbi:hypothetical protein EYF80_061289 [Liparis tanakae]|uniref:Uncharacterized protein n=1 Tax=Liparis tanakae TaxID=230148 RepID=A0A4Z2EIB1_9TELE|nr:hypothetical protein EYF80_061289 [Liparis tanakae]